MEHSLLYLIKDSIQKDIELFAPIMHIEIEVVDSSLVRIASSGLRKRECIQDMHHKRNVYQHAIKTGERQFVFNPGLDRLCQSCAERSECRFLFKVVAPVICGNNGVVGAIGLLAKNERQKTDLQNHLALELDILDKMQELINGRIYQIQVREKEADLTGLLDLTVGSFPTAVLILKSGRELFHNLMAENILRLNVPELKNVEIRVVYVSGFPGKINKIVLQNREVSVAGDSVRTGDYEILIFRRISKKTEITPLKELEKREIEKALRMYGNTKAGKAKAAEKLGLSLATLYRKLKQE